MIECYLNMIKKHHPEKNKIILGSLFVLLSVVLLAIAIAKELSGFGMIFTVIIIFLVLVLGAVGAFLNQKDYEIPLINQPKFVKLKKITSIWVILFISLFGLVIIQNFVFLRQVMYVSRVEVNEVEDVLYFKFEPNTIDRQDINRFAVNFHFSKTLEDVSSDVSIELYIGGVKYLEQKMTQDESDDNLYHIVVQDDDLELPLYTY